MPVFAPSLHLATPFGYISEENLIHWYPDFYKCNLGDISRLPGLKASSIHKCGLYIFVFTGFTGLYVSAYFKRVCLRVWFKISSNESLSFGIQTGLGKRNKGNLPRINHSLDNHRSSTDNQELVQGSMIRLISYMNIPLQDTGGRPFKAGRASGFD